MKAIKVLVLFITIASLNAQTAKMLKDIYAGFDGSRPIDKQPLTVGNKVYFLALAGIVGEELYITDGTSAGTRLVKDINTAQSGSSDIDNLYAFNDKVIFTAKDGVSGNELWISDGTEVGTKLIKDIFVGSGSGIASTPKRNVIVHNGFIYLAAQKEAGKIGIWKSDGTTAGTKELFANLSATANPDQFTVFNNSIYFFAITDVTKGGKLHRLDLMTEQVFIIDDPNLGMMNSIDELTVCGNRMYFAADLNFGFGKEPCYSDGTPAGTNILKNLVNPGSSNPYYFTLLPNNKVMFYTNGFTFVTDGTSAGTISLPVFGSGSRPVKLGNKYILNGLLTNNTAIGNELIITDGTVAGTQLLSDINKNLTLGSNESYPAHFTLLNNKVYFSALDTLNDKELWETDGTTLGTKRVVDINPGLFGSLPSQFTTLGNNLFMFAFFPNFGDEPTLIDLVTKTINITSSESSINIINYLEHWKVQFESNDVFHYDLIDINGVSINSGIISGTGTISKPHTSGLYFLQVKNAENKVLETKKLFKN